ncbi:MAG: hypothetical protein HETSPECPRED_002111 [Heterodermia speciosa]|uniref:Uncharacterized protein n=1 Tax=Heterodermia speciosa TaxID=116794 RepID=A0A8H3J3B4_9LECA|nr:MAG: hypothetical protein HETSPECPRED_002111 [Heterodermia speciosa]
MPLGSARLAYAEHVTGQRRDQATRISFNDSIAQASSGKTAKNKKKPKLFRLLARKLSGTGPRSHHATHRAPGAHQQHLVNSQDPRDQGMIYLPSAHERQRMDEGLYNLNYLLEALDPSEAGNSDGDTEPSPQDSEDILVPNKDRTPTNEEQELRMQGHLSLAENAFGEGWRDEVDSVSSTLAEKDQPIRVS